MSFRVLLVCSSGGHLAQLARLRPWWEKHDRVWVTFPTADAISVLRGERVVWGYHPTTRNIPNLVRNTAVAWRVLRHYRPHLVVSTGAGIAFPFFVLGRILEVDTVYVEVFDRIDSATLTGRLCYPLADLFVLQWPEQLRFYPRGTVVGALI
jgi:UDP-N-acetylglucosamine:LPS N-acetylglucosamine transferase